MENERGQVAALFDLDGVIIDSESQYSLFWSEVGKKYYPNDPTFAAKIKGSTLTQILNDYFGADDRMQTAVKQDLSAFERQMSFDYLPGVIEFVGELRSNGVKMAVVTSSNQEKMSQVYAQHPELKSWFDCILTAEHATKSKPAPDCYLQAAEVLGMERARCVVFEDSFNGLQAGRNAQMKVVGLATTLPRTEVEALADITIDNYLSFNLEKLNSLLSLGEKTC